MKEALSQAGIEFSVIDINEGMLHLKKFLKYRDTKPEFAEVRESGRVGLPCIVVGEKEDEQVYFELPPLETLK